MSVGRFDVDDAGEGFADVVELGFIDMQQDAQGFEVDHRLAYVVFFNNFPKLLVLFELRRRAHKFGVKPGAAAILKNLKSVGDPVEGDEYFEGLAKIHDTREKWNGGAFRSCREAFSVPVFVEVENC